MELTAQQEDYLLEEAQERARESQEGLFESWLRDNKSELIDEFLEQNEQEFFDFCKEEFKLWKETK